MAASESLSADRVGCAHGSTQTKTRPPEVDRMRSIAPSDRVVGIEPRLILDLYSWTIRLLSRQWPHRSGTLNLPWNATKGTSRWFNRSAWIRNGLGHGVDATSLQAVSARRLELLVSNVDAVGVRLYCNGAVILVGQSVWAERTLQSLRRVTDQGSSQALRCVPTMGSTHSALLASLQRGWSLRHVAHKEHSFSHVLRLGNDHGELAAGSHHLAASSRLQRYARRLLPGLRLQPDRQREREMS